MNLKLIFRYLCIVFLKDRFGRFPKRKQKMRHKRGVKRKIGIF